MFSVVQYQWHHLSLVENRCLQLLPIHSNLARARPYSWDCVCCLVQTGINTATNLKLGIFPGIFCKIWNGSHVTHTWLTHDSLKWDPTWSNRNSLSTDSTDPKEVVGQCPYFSGANRFQNMTINWHLYMFININVSFSTITSNIPFKTLNFVPHIIPFWIPPDFCSKQRALDLWECRWSRAQHLCHEARPPELREELRRVPEEIYLWILHIENGIWYRLI